MQQLAWLLAVQVERTWATGSGSSRSKVGNSESKSCTEAAGAVKKQAQVKWRRSQAAKCRAKKIKKKDKKKKKKKTKKSHKLKRATGRGGEEKEKVVSFGQISSGT